MKKITLLILITSMVFGDLPSSDIHPAESSTIIDTKPENHTNRSPSKKIKKIVSLSKKKLFLLYPQRFLMVMSAVAIKAIQNLVFV